MNISILKWKTILRMQTLNYTLDFRTHPNVIFIKISNIIQNCIRKYSNTHEIFPPSIHTFPVMNVSITLSYIDNFPFNSNIPYSQSNLHASRAHNVFQNSLYVWWNPLFTAPQTTAHHGKTWRIFISIYMEIISKEVNLNEFDQNFILFRFKYSRRNLHKFLTPLAYVCLRRTFFFGRRKTYRLRGPPFAVSFINKYFMRKAVRNVFL